MPIPTIPFLLLAAGTSPDQSAVDKYVKPYVDVGAFSGVVLLAKHGKPILNRAYGYANAELKVRNTVDTRFHIASVSKPFTAAAILLLEEEGKLKVTDFVKDLIPDFPNGHKIRIHDLLTHRSGIPNINNFPEYDAWSFQHQTPKSIVDLFKNMPLEFEPGSQYSYSNSNYNLLAYLIELKSGKSYGDFLKEKIFSPAGMHDTYHDDNPRLLHVNRAYGYIPDGFGGIQNAPSFDWSIKTGNGSLVSTASDLLKFDEALVQGKILKPSSLEKMWREGYGWFIGERFGRNHVRINGRSPGFTAEYQHWHDGLTVLVLSNNYAATPTNIAFDLAAMQLGQEYKIPDLRKPEPHSDNELAPLLGTYKFGADFYQPNQTYELVANQGFLQVRHPSGFSFNLMPQPNGRWFCLDFWADIKFERSGDKVIGLTWNDGRTYKASKLSS